MITDEVTNVTQASVTDDASVDGVATSTGCPKAPGMAITTRWVDTLLVARLAPWAPADRRGMAGPDRAWLPNEPPHAIVSPVAR